MDLHEESRLQCRLIRLGGRYERASLQQPPDYPAMIEIENKFGQVQDDPAVTFWPGMWFVRGRNFIRRLRRLEEVAL